MAEYDSDDGGYNETGPDVIFRTHVAPYMYEPKAKRQRVDNSSRDREDGSVAVLTKFLEIPLALLIPAPLYYDLVYFHSQVKVHSHDLLSAVERRIRTVFTKNKSFFLFTYFGSSQKKNKRQSLSTWANTPVFVGKYFACLHISVNL